MRAPDQPVTGWRYWQLEPGGWLRSVSHRRFQWPPGRPLRAGCIGGGHAAPAEGCSCGVHGSPDLEALRDHGLCLGPEVLVVGQVALWGRVVSDEHGLRGEHGYPASLAVVRETVSEELLAPVVEALGAYGVPVSVTSAAEAVGDVSAALLAFQAMARQTAGPGAG